jgi:hypothetical protein
MARKPSDDRATDDPELLTDPEGVRLLREGLTRFLQRQKEDPDFPPPIWLGPRGKRHSRQELLAYAIAKRNRPAEPKPPSKWAASINGKTRRAAQRLGCRLTADLTPHELDAWTAAGKPQRVQLGEYELVPIAALQRLTARAPAAPDDQLRPRRKGAPSTTAAA